MIAYLKRYADRRFTAREVYDYLKGEIAGVNRTTVYRNLERLSEQGELVRYKEPNQKAWYYQYSDEHSHCDRHIHARCSECGKIFHLENAFVEEFEEKIHRVYGLNVNPSETMIIGKCEDCGKTES